MRVDHIGIAVRDLENARNFLAETLGLDLTRELDLPDRGEIAAFYRCGEVDIELVQLTDAAKSRERLGGADVDGRVDHIAIQVDDIEQIAERLRIRGIRTQKPEVESVGNARFVVTTPDTSGGVVYQFIQRR
jgi:methylmalonyl-CoA/ethylmalonyl-CoA epimerase